MSGTQPKQRMGTAQAIILLLGGGVVISAIYWLGKKMNEYRNAKEANCGPLCDETRHNIKCGLMMGGFSTIVSLVGLGVWYKMSKTLHGCGKGSVATKSLLILILVPLALSLPFLFAAPSCYDKQHANRHHHHSGRLQGEE